MRTGGSKLQPMSQIQSLPDPSPLAEWCSAQGIAMTPTTAHTHTGVLSATFFVKRPARGMLGWQIPEEAQHEDPWGNSQGLCVHPRWNGKCCSCLDAFGWWS